MALHAKLQLSAPALKGPIVACRSPPLRLTDRPGRGGDILPLLPHLPPLPPPSPLSSLRSFFLASFAHSERLRCYSQTSGSGCVSHRSALHLFGAGGGDEGRNFFKWCRELHAVAIGSSPMARRHLQSERERTDVFIGRGLIKVDCESLLFFSPGPVSLNLHIPF